MFFSFVLAFYCPVVFVSVYDDGHVHRVLYVCILFQSVPSKMCVKRFNAHSWMSFNGIIMAPSKKISLILFHSRCSVAIFYDFYANKGHRKENTHTHQARYHTNRMTIMVSTTLPFDWDFFIGQMKIFGIEIEPAPARILRFTLFSQGMKKECEVKLWPSKWNGRE